MSGAQAAFGARLTNQFTIDAIDGKEDIAVSNASDVDEGEVENEESDEEEKYSGSPSTKRRKTKSFTILVDNDKAGLNKSCVAKAFRKI